MKDNEKLSIVTEIGVFGELDINDPTEKEIKRKVHKKDIDQLIKESIDENINIDL